MAAIMAVASSHRVVLDHGRKLPKASPKEIVANPESHSRLFGLETIRTYRHPERPSARTAGLSASTGLSRQLADVTIEIGDRGRLSLVGGQRGPRQKHHPCARISGLVADWDGQNHVLAQTSRHCRVTRLRNSEYRPRRKVRHTSSPNDSSGKLEIGAYVAECQRPVVVRTLKSVQHLPRVAERRKQLRRYDERR